MVRRFYITDSRMFVIFVGISRSYLFFSMTGED